MDIPSPQPHNYTLGFVDLPGDAGGDVKLVTTNEIYAAFLTPHGSIGSYLKQFDLSDIIVNDINAKVVSIPNEPEHLLYSTVADFQFSMVNVSLSTHTATYEPTDLVGGLACRGPRDRFRRRGVLVG
jgi:hypothetical protein